MRNEPDWLTADDAVELNRYAVRDTREAHNLMSRGLLESAVDNCRNHFLYGDEDLVDLACTLMLTVARNHAFEQGNKRTGFLAARAFLAINGYSLDVPDRRWLADLVIAAIQEPFAEAAVRFGVRAHVTARDAR